MQNHDTPKPKTADHLTDRYIADAYQSLWSILPPGASVTITAENGFVIRVQHPRRGIDVTVHHIILHDAIMLALERVEGAYRDT